MIWILSKGSRTLAESIRFLTLKNREFSSTMFHKNHKPLKGYVPDWTSFTVWWWEVSTIPVGTCFEINTILTWSLTTQDFLAKRMIGYSQSVLKIVFRIRTIPSDTSDTSRFQENYIREKTVLNASWEYNRRSSQEKMLYIFWTEK